MRLAPRSLTGRLVAGAAVFILLALLVTGVAVDFALHRFVHGQIDQRLDAQLATLADALEAQPDGSVALVRSVDGPPFDNPRTGWFWTIRTPTRTWQARGLGAFDEPPEPPPPPNHPDRPDHPRPMIGTGPDGRPVVMRIRDIVIGTRPVHLAAAAPLDAVNGPLRDALLPLITALTVLGTGLVGATLIQVRLGLQPLRDLQRALVAVRTGRAERLPVQQPAEVRPLVVEMNTLLDQNAANLERARRHVANLAHGLKTPLATLSLALDQPGLDSDGRLHGLAVAMDRRIRHHLARARAAALGSPVRSRLTLAPRIADHVAAFAKIHADRAIACETVVPAALAVACDAQDLDEMVGNVLDNAFKWARHAVRITATAQDQDVVLTIEDDGPGLPADKRTGVLRPGERLDESVPGDGFGLSIVQELVELYGGRVVLREASLGGLSVTLTLPGADRSV